MWIFRPAVGRRHDLEKQGGPDGSETIRPFPFPGSQPLPSSSRSDDWILADEVESPIQI
jgi:hypothetical protein